MYKVKSKPLHHEDRSIRNTRKEEPGAPVGPPRFILWYPVRPNEG